ncbi:MAG: hypothetical protein KBF27_09645 [Cypionkella sp.]|nr:hypothetical protein [Cypionkella sp.]
MKRLAFAALFLVSACGTPQEQCIESVTRDMRMVDRLIAETEGNLQRGFAYQEVTISVPVWVNCGRRPTVENPNPEPRMCLDDREQTTRRAVAIDLRAEQVKLDGLKAKRKLQAKAAAQPIAQCKAQYPE